VIERENQLNNEVNKSVENFVVREIEPFDSILDFSKKIDSEILQKPFDLVVAELDRINFDLNQTHLFKSPTFFGLDTFEINKHNDFLVAKDLLSKNEYILRQKQGQRVSFIESTFIKSDCDIWQGYCLTSKNEFVLNEGYSYLDMNIFSPENLAKNGELIKSDRRNVYRLIVDGSVFYIKSSFVNILARGDLDYYDQFENFPKINKLSSKAEAERFLQLSKLGINVPRVVGYSTGQTNDILVVEGIDGVYPTESNYSENRFNILEQDKQILVALTALGLEKKGFEDFDDKILKDGKLYLIDVDECNLLNKKIN